MLHAVLCALPLALLGPAEAPTEGPTDVPRAQQAVPPVGLVPHEAPEVVVEPDEAAEEEKPPEPKVSVIFMPQKKKAIGVKAPAAPLKCEEPLACRRLLIAGGISSALTAGTIAAGAILTAQPNVVISGEPAYMRSTRDIGLLVMSSGVMTGFCATLMLVASLRGRKDLAQKAGAWLREGSVRF